MSIKDRIQLYIDTKAINVNEFERSIQASKSYWRNTKSISAEILTKIVGVYSDLNTDWLLTGEGEMLKGDNTYPIPHVEKMDAIGIPHIEVVEAFCGPGQSFDVTVMRKECPVYNIPGMDEADFTIKAKGRSMINKVHQDRSIKEGDYIGCRKSRANVIRYGEVYALATADGVMVKIIRESDRDGYILLESFNAEEGFKPFYYPVIDVYDMALVVAVASINRWA